MPSTLEKFVHINIRIMCLMLKGGHRVFRLYELYIVLIPALMARTASHSRYLNYRLQFDAKCNLFMALAVSPSPK